MKYRHFLKKISVNDNFLNLIGLSTLIQETVLSSIDWFFEKESFIFSQFLNGPFTVGPHPNIFTDWFPVFFF
jgi:hypothetical protein